MPPKKKYVLSTTIRWSAFEVDLFRYLGAITQNSMADDMRAAIRAYAYSVPGFDAESFASFMRKSALADTPKGLDRDRLAMELETFVAGHARQTTSQKYSEIHVSDAKIREARRFTSSTQDFDMHT